MPIQVQSKTKEEIKEAEKKKKEELKKAAMPKPKRYYDVRVEALVPCLITYRILADDEHDALMQVNKKPPTGIKPNIQLKRAIKATVYDAGSSLVRLVKAFRV